MESCIKIIRKHIYIILCKHTYTAEFETIKMFNCYRSYEIKSFVQRYSLATKKLYVTESKLQLASGLCRTLSHFFFHTFPLHPIRHYVDPARRDAGPSLTNTRCN